MTLTKPRIVLIALFGLSVLALTAYSARQFSPEKRLARHVVKARLYTKTGQTGAAAKEYELALGIDPENEAALCELGTLRLALDQPDRAEKHFADCVASHPQAACAWTGLMRVRLALKDPAGAAEAARRLLAQRRDAASLIVYGDAMAASEHYREALSAYREAAEAGPDEFQPVQHLVRFLFALERRYEARQILERYAARETAQERPAALLALAEAELAESKPQQALAHLDRALAIARQPELLVRRAEANYLLQHYDAALNDLASARPGALASKIRAGCLLEKGDFAGALREAQAAERALPKDHFVALLMARAHYGVGHAMEAQEQARRALLLQPDFAPAQNLLMTMLLDSEQIERAITFGRSLLDRPQRNHAALRLLARAYLSAGREDDAREAFSLARSQANDPLSAYTFAKQKETSDAQQAIQRLQKLDPKEQDTADVQYLLGQAYLRGRNLQQALVALEKSVGLDPERYESQSALAGLLFSIGQTALAAERMERVVAKFPDAIVPAMWLAQMRRQQRRFDEAAALYAAVLAQPDAPNEAVGGLISAKLAQATEQGQAELIEALMQSGVPERKAAAFVIQAVLKGKQNDTATGAQLLDEALALAPGLIEAMHQKALYLAGTGKFADAAEMLERIDPSSPTAAAEWLDAAVALLLAGKHEQALQRALEQDILFNTPETLLVVIAALVKSNQTEAAQRRLEQLPAAEVELRPLVELLRLNARGEVFEKLALADMFSRAGLFAWALDTLEAAAALATPSVSPPYEGGEKERPAGTPVPPNPDLAALRVTTLMRNGRGAEAVGILARLVDEHPSRPDFALALADLRLAEGKRDEALALYRKVLAVAPDHVRALFSCAKLLHAHGEHQRAADLLLKALKQSPRDLAIVSSYAWLLAVDLKSPQQALSYASDLCSGAPHNAAALDVAGWIFYLNKRFEDAARVLSYAALLAPQSGDVAYHYGMALLGCSRQEEALRELRRVRTLGSALQHVAAAEQAIAEIEFKRGPFTTETLRHGEQ